MIFMQGTHILVERKKNRTLVFFESLTGGQTNLAISQFFPLVPWLSHVCTELAGSLV